MKTPTDRTRSSNQAYVISPCYRLVLPAEPAPRPTPREDRRTDTPRGSTVRRVTAPW